VAASIPGDFFTVASFGTLGGCVSLTTVATGALNMRFGWNKRKIGFLVAFLAVAASLFLSDEITNPKACVVGACNALLVYLTAAGASGFLGRDGDLTGTRGLHRVQRSWFGNWFW